MTTTVYAGRFDFEDGGTYCGGWEDGKAHGYGVCTGPKSMGEFTGVWQFGYEVSGIYIWPSGNCYQGQWMSGKRHGLGVEKKQRWIYKGEWSQGFKGRYGVRISESSGAKYEGTWANGLQDGYGCESYADGGTYFGQMAQGMRNGYGIRKSISYGSASRYRSKDIKDSLTSLRSEEDDERVQRERDRRFDETRGGFVLRAKSDPTEEIVLAGTASSRSIVSTTLDGLLRRRRNSFGQSQERKPSLRKTLMAKFTRQKSTNDIDDANVRAASTSRVTNMKKSSFRSTSSNNSVDSRTSNRTAPAGVGGGNQAATLPLSRGGRSALLEDGEQSFISQDEITDVNCIEVYMGEWKQDKRTGFGIAERSDGLKYEGEWFNNKKNGYGVTTFKDGTKEEGKYKNNVLFNDKKKGKLVVLRSNKQRDRIATAVNAALKAAQIAQQRADIAISRAVNARAKLNAAEVGAKQARSDSEYARIRAHEIAPDFIQPGEHKKMPEIVLDIDRPGNSAFVESPSNHQMSPNTFKRQSNQIKQEPYMNSIVRAMSNNPNEAYINWQQQQQQMQYSPSQQYSQTSMMLAQQQQQQQQNHHQNYSQPMKSVSKSQMHNPHNTNDAQMYSHIPGQQQYLDMQKLQADSLNPLSYNNNVPSYVNYSYDNMMPNLTYDDLQKQMYQIDPSSTLYTNDQLSNQNSFDDPNFQRNNPKRQTLKRSQRVVDTSVEDLANPTQHLKGPKTQYSNASSNQESGIGSSVHTSSIQGTNTDSTLNNRRHQQIQQNTQIPLTNSDSHNSGFIREKSQSRRKSLPSIVKSQLFKEDETTHSSNELHNKTEELYIIENGIRKRITEQQSNTSITNRLTENEYANQTVNNNNNNTNTKNNNKNTINQKSILYNEDNSPKLKRKVVIESITSLNAVESKMGSKRVSMPSIDTLLSSKFSNKVMSREEANRLSSLRREQLRNFANNGNSTLKQLTNKFPEYLSRHRLFIAIILFNISLAIWFFQLLK